MLILLLLVLGLFVGIHCYEGYHYIAMESPDYEPSIDDGGSCSAYQQWIDNPL